jgi:hypothetical protein
MYQNLESVKKLILDKSGKQTSEMLSTIFDDKLRNLGINLKPSEFLVEYSREFFPKENRRELKHSRNMDDGGGFGNNNVFNFIPSAGPNGSCSSFCLTIVAAGFGRNSLFHSSRFNNSRSLNFLQAILLLAAYWFACFNINEENLILTPDWNEEEFDNNYKSIIDNYCNHHQKKVFIVEVSNGGLFLRYPYS